jgi:DNA-binding beta-propeller fold protein YncE
MLIRSVLVFILSAFAGIVLAQTGKVQASVAFTIEEKDLIPEGITYDPGTHQFFVSSINKEKVVAVNENGSARDLLKRGQDGILQTLGMKVDQMRRRLWVVSNKQGKESSASVVHIFNIETGKLIKKFILPDDTIHLFNDLILTGTGDAYITDSYSAVIYTVPADLTELKPFIESDKFLKWSNGLTISPDNTILYVTTGPGLVLVNLKTLEVKPMIKPETISTSGIDGLVFYKGSLLGVVNGRDDESEMCIARYKLSHDLKEIVGMSIIDQGNPLFNFPTTCVMVDDYLYCLANTSLRIFFSKEMNYEDKLHSPVILKYKITD